jgi:hypothetical protein
MAIFNSKLFVYQRAISIDQWEFQEPKMEVLTPTLWYINSSTLADRAWKTSFH